MPQGLWRVVKRALCDITGQDVIGTEKELRTFLDREHLNFECGSFETSGNKSVTFVRITSVREVLPALIHSFQSEGQLSCLTNIQNNHLVALIAGDKGSAHTKLVITVLNAANPHSSKRCKLLAIFEGDKDRYECIEKIADMWEQIIDVRKEDPDFHQRAEGQLVDRSKEAVEGRKHLHQLKNSKNEMEKELN
ncbi:Hypothetical predicted protein [Paramuricea clavata]|uniref:Uncharacterized protein n=1 Tax=Paramuricea clavata TaxID=317549 RepID=A0A7D9HAI6_PARCT|nr:Hypothetical predicted protein [Paramuricea clavata]